MESKMILMLDRKHKIFLYLLFLFFILQSKGVSAEENVENVYRDLAEKGVATYENGCRAILHFVNVPAEAMTFDEIVAELKEKGIIGRRWKYKADKTLTRGIMAYMTCKVLKIKGGLTMRAINATKRFAGLICSGLKIKDGLPFPDIGMTKRYAHLECLDMGLMPAGHKKKFLTGHDLLALLYRIEQYLKAEEKGKKQEEETEKENEQEKQEQIKV